MELRNEERFDPRKHITFRGRFMEQLTRDELIEALSRALETAVEVLNNMPQTNRRP